MLIDDLLQPLSNTPNQLRLGDGAVLLRNFLAEHAATILQQITNIAKRAPFRQVATPNGLPMSVAMTNCGAYGWVVDSKGYRYTAIDPLTGLNWPTMPTLFVKLACEAAKQAGFEGFKPNVCLINQYKRASKLSLHQDKDEINLQAPIVSFSLGLSATFLWGGLKRSDKVYKVPVMHGDVIVWGGVDRLRYHGIAPLAKDCHPLMGEQRINLTFRQTT